VRRGLAAEADPVSFAAAWADADAEFAARIERARALVGEVKLPDEELERIARVCAAFDVDGMRADLVTARAALAHAAWHGRAAVTVDDVRAAAALALPHRRRRDPFDAPGLDDDQLNEALGDPPPPDPDPDGGGAPPPADGADGAGSGEQHGSSGPAPEDVAPVGTPFRPRLLATRRGTPGPPGRRSPGPTTLGRTVGDRRPVGAVDAAGLHLSATLRAAARHQRERGRAVGAPLRVRAGDLREARREGRVGNLVLFCVDASGSMGARARMAAVKAAVLSLLLDAYQRRDKVGLVTFRGTGATVTLPPTSSVEAGAARLRSLPSGGRTPLATGLLTARQVLEVERRRDPSRAPLLVLLSDGRGNVGSDPVGAARRAAAGLAADGVAAVVVDCESGPVRLHLAGAIAVELDATLVRLEDLAADGLRGLVADLRGVRRGVA